MYGEKIKKLMRRNGWSQKYVAEHTEFTESSVSRYLDSTYPPLEFIIKFCDIINIPLANFFQEGDKDYTDLGAEEVEFLREYKDLPIDLKNYIWQAVKLTQEAYYAGLKRRA